MVRLFTPIYSFNLIIYVSFLSTHIQIHITIITASSHDGKSLKPRIEMYNVRGIDMAISGVKDRQSVLLANCMGTYIDSRTNMVVVVYICELYLTLCVAPNIGIVLLAMDYDRNLGVAGNTHNICSLHIIIATST